MSVLADCGFTCTNADIRTIVQMCTNKEGRAVKQWKDNLPGYDFAARNNLTQRLATNIKSQSVIPNEIKKFLKNFRPGLEETHLVLIYNKYYRP